MKKYNHPIQIAYNIDRQILWEIYVVDDKHKKIHSSVKIADKKVSFTETYKWGNLIKTNLMHSNGKTHIETQFRKENIIHGTVRVFNTAGGITASIKYKNGLKHGPAHKFDGIYGEIISTEYYIKGFLESREKYEMFLNFEKNIAAQACNHSAKYKRNETFQKYNHLNRTFGNNSQQNKYRHK